MKRYGVVTRVLPEKPDEVRRLHVDMAKMAADEETGRWWTVCKPLLRPVVALPPGEVWTPLEEVFHTG